MKKIWMTLLGLFCLFTLSACTPEGNPLPQGMDETEVLEQGRSVVQLLNQGSYQEVYEQMREDAQQTSDTEDIAQYMSTTTEKAGLYETEQEAMATGQTLKDTGEEYATAVLYCEHSKKDVVYRIAFDQDMALMGFEIKIK